MIFNDRRKIVVWAQNRCGSNFVQYQADKYPKRWKPIWEQELEPITPDYLTIKVIRDPVERFSSWFQSFVTNNDFIKQKNYLIPIRRNNLDEWFERFKVFYHYDTHTCLQSVRYQMYGPLNHSVRYLRVEDLSKFFNAEPYEPNKSSEFFKDFLSPILPKVKELYELDYEWFNSIQDKFINVSETIPVDDN